MTFIIHIVTIFFRIITAFFEMLRVSSRFACITIVAFAALFMSAVASAQTVLRVDIGNGSVTGDGSGWNSSAFRFLQDALEVAAADATPQDPHEIWVAQGTYRPDQRAANDFCDDNATLDPLICCPPYGDCDYIEVFIIPGHVTLYGGFEGGETTVEQRDWENNETILSGDLQNSDSVTIYDNGELVLDFQNYSDNSFLIVEVDGATAVLDGFTVRGAIHVSGAEARLLDCIFDVSEGPALRFSRGSSAQIWRCRLTGEDGESLIDRIIAEPDARVFVDALTGFLPLRARSAAK